MTGGNHCAPGNFALHLECAKVVVRGGAMNVSRVKQTVTLGAENVVRIDHDRPVYRWQTALDREPSTEWIKVFRASTLADARLPKFRDTLDFHGDSLFFDAAEDLVEEA